MNLYPDTPDTTAACEGCNVCLHGECYACMVGVATGPESHDTCCGSATVRPAGVEHRVHVAVEGEDYYWECDCGRSGSGAELNGADGDIHSDRHIDYTAGDRRVDTSRSPSGEPMFGGAW